MTLLGSCNATILVIRVRIRRGHENLFDIIILFSLRSKNETEERNGRKQLRYKKVVIGVSMRLKDKQCNEESEENKKKK